jgi:hypothetical protein
VHHVHRVLQLEWAIYGRRVRLGVILAVALAALAAFEIGEALLPHHVQNTVLKYQEKSNGIREYFGTGVRELPSQRHAR